MVVVNSMACVGPNTRGLPLFSKLSISRPCEPPPHLRLVASTLPVALCPRPFGFGPLAAFAGNTPRLTDLSLGPLLLLLMQLGALPSARSSAAARAANAGCGFP